MLVIYALKIDLSFLSRIPAMHFDLSPHHTHNATAAVNEIEVPCQIPKYAMATKLCFMCKNVNPPLVPGVQVRLVHLAVLPYHVGQVFHPNRMCLVVPEFQAVQDHQEDQVGLVVRSGEESGGEIMGKEKWKG